MGGTGSHIPFFNYCVQPALKASLLLVTSALLSQMQLCCGWEALMQCLGTARWCTGSLSAAIGKRLRRASEVFACLVGWSPCAWATAVQPLPKLSTHTRLLWIAPLLLPFSFQSMPFNDTSAQCPIPTLPLPGNFTVCHVQPGGLRAVRLQASLIITGVTQSTIAGTDLHITGRGLSARDRYAFVSEAACGTPSLALPVTPGPDNTTALVPLPLGQVVGVCYTHKPGPNPVWVLLLSPRQSMCALNQKVCAHSNANSCQLEGQLQQGCPSEARFFLFMTALQDSPQGPPTANRHQIFTANHCQPLPTTNRHPPPPPIANHQPPPTATNRQPATANL